MNSLITNQYVLSMSCSFRRFSKKLHLITESVLTYTQEILPDIKMKRQKHMRTFIERFDEVIVLLGDETIRSMVITSRAAWRSHALTCQ